jgi:hypothetical protein
MQTSPAQQVAAEVRAEMARQMRTQTQMVEALGHSQQWWSRRLTGAVAFDITELMAIAEWLQIDLMQLLPKVAA